MIPALVLLPRERPGRVGPIGVLLALAVTALVDAHMLHALPPRTSVPGPQMAAGIAVAGLVGLIAHGRTEVTWRRLPVPLLLSAAVAAGVWAGVPETSYALLVAGVIAGSGIALVLVRLHASSALVVALAAAPPMAATLGAAGESHALIGGLLTAAPFLALLSLPTRRPMSVPAATAVAVTGLTAGAALLMARGVAVERTWATTAVVVAGSAVVVILLAVVLRRTQRAVAA